MKNEWVEVRAKYLSAGFNGSENDYESLLTELEEKRLHKDFFAMLYYAKTSLCLFKQSSKTDGMKYTSETWVRVPSGYTGIVFLYDCYDWYKYTFDHDNMEPRSVNDLITKETKYFRLGSGGDFITYNSDDSNLEQSGDELSGEYLPEANSDVYIRIKKINEDTWQYDTLFVADDTVVEGFPTRHYKYKEDNMWECVSEDYRGYFIQKLDENQIYNDEIYDCTIYTRK